jgi:tetratricopeptide (TPR) repeat protein
LLYGGILFFLVLFGISFWATRSASVWQSIPGLSRLAGTSAIGDAPRLIAWRAAWDGFREKPFLGWGWENYNVVFNAHYDPQILASGYGETRFDKPHNIYLEYLVAGGLSLFLAFLVFLFFIFRAVLRYRDGVLQPFLFAALIGYLVRSFFVFDTLGPLLLLGVLLALLLGDEDSSAVPSAPSTRVSWGGYVIFGIFCIMAYLIQVRTVVALGHQYDGYRLTAKGQITAGIDAFAAARYVWTPYASDFAKDYALVLVEAYFYNTDRVTPEQATRAIDTFTVVSRAHPQDAYYHYALIDLCNQVYALNPEKYGALAEQEAKTAFQLSPRRQQIYFSFAKTKQLEGDLPGALTLVQQGIELTPMLPDGYFYYSLLSFTNGDGVQGYSFYRRSLELGKQWKNYYERITTAGFLANYGYFADAIPLYRAAIEEIKDPIEKTDARVKLAVALFMTGDRVEAKSLLTAIAARYDLTTSPLYGDLAPILRDLGISP